MIRPALLALALSIGAPALAQEMPTPRTDLDQVRKEALADRNVRAAVADANRNLEARLKDDRRDIEVIVKTSHAKAGDRILDVGKAPLQGLQHLAQAILSDQSANLRLKRFGVVG